MYFRSIDKLNDFDENRTTSGSSVKSQVMDLKTLPMFSPLKRGVSRFDKSSPGISYAFFRFPENLPKPRLEFKIFQDIN